MKGKKRFASVFSVFMAGIIFGGCSLSQERTPPEEIRLTWYNYQESVDAYVYSYYSYAIPEVFDQNGTEYNVTVAVTDSDGKKVDNTCGYFLVGKADDYTVTYTVDDGEKLQEKKTTVSGIVKSRYSLCGTDLVYGIGERVDLNDKVVASVEGEVQYSVEYGGVRVPLTDNAFTPTEEGTYKVTATLPKQPEYDFDIIVVDKTQIPYPSGMILDDADGEDINVSTKINYTFVSAGSKKKIISENNPNGYTAEEYAIALAAAKEARDKLSLSQSASVSTSFDETAKFDESSNGSTKISVVYAESCQPFDVPISIKPKFGKSYYQSLANGGYEYIAVRMKLVDGADELENYGLLYFSGDNGTSLSFRRVSQAGELSPVGTDTAIWSGTGYQRSGWGWFELLLPIQSFITTYGENVQLFKLRTFASVTGDKDGVTTFKGNNGGLDIYIDNIYAAKALDGVNVERQELKTTQAQFSLSELQIQDVADIDGLNINYTVDDRAEPFPEETLSFTEEGEYKLEVRARNRYGKRTAEIVVGDNYTLPSSYGIVKEFASVGDVTVSEISAVNTSGGGAQATVTYTTDVKYDDENSAGSICVSGIRNNTWADISVKPTGSKAYYQFLKENGYSYVTVRIGLIAAGNDNAVYLHAGGATNLHQNTAVSTVQRYDPATGGLKNLGGSNGQLYKWLSVGAEWWAEVSVPIDEFLASYDKRSTPILRVFGAYSNSDIYLDGVYITKNGTLS